MKIIILNCALKSLDRITDYYESAHFHFIYAQLQLLLCKPNTRRFDKDMYILAAEIHNISPSAYKMIRNSGAIVLPRVELIKKLLSNNSQDDNLKIIMQKIKP